MKLNIPSFVMNPSSTPNDQKSNDGQESDLYKTQKVLTEFTTHVFTDPLTSPEGYKCSELSDIILNSEEFWLKMVQESEAESSSGSPSSARKNTFAKRKNDSPVKSSLPEQSVEAI